MIHLLVSLNSGDVFTCDHRANSFKDAVTNIMSTPILFFNDAAIMTSHIAAIELAEDDDNTETIPGDSSCRNKGSIS